MTHYSMFLHNVSRKSWVFKTEIKFADNDVMYWYVNVGGGTEGNVPQSFVLSAPYRSHLSSSVCSNAEGEERHYGWCLETGV